MASSEETLIISVPDGPDERLVRLHFVRLAGVSTAFCGGVARARTGLLIGGDGGHAHPQQLRKRRPRGFGRLEVTVPRGAREDV